MAQTWLSIRVDLLRGRGEDVWPHPGRIFAASRRHTFWQLATAIDDAFARWDRAHLSQFELTDGVRVGRPADDLEGEELLLDARRVQLGRLSTGEQFMYEFDFGDRWEHLCQVGEHRIDPQVELAVVPNRPLPYLGWGVIPDQYGRRWIDDDGDLAGLGRDPG